MNIRHLTKNTVRVNTDKPDTISVFFLVHYGTLGKHNVTFRFSLHGFKNLYERQILNDIWLGVTTRGTLTLIGTLYPLVS